MSRSQSRDQAARPGEIQDYWTDRARAASGAPTATTSDVHMRRLEGQTFRGAIAELELPAGSRIIDVGCGDGRTTADVASYFPELQFIGVDYSDGMIENARRADSDAVRDGRLEFQVGNVLALSEQFADPQFDVALSSRCLINLTSLEDQQRAIAQVAALLRPGGHYIAIENFLDGQEELNRARAAMGLAPIPVRWHNLFFDPEEFARSVKPHFDVREYRNFASSYYLATRVLYSRLCKNRGEEPDYDHEIHRVSVDLPASGNFSPVRMVILERRG